MAEKEPKPPLRVTISQAANLLGISEKTIRRAIADSEILYIVVRGVYKINFESLIKWSQSRTKIRNKMEQEGIGQYVEKWKIKNKLYSPNPEALPKKKKKVPEEPAEINENIQNYQKNEDLE